MGKNTTNTNFSSDIEMDTDWIDDILDTFWGLLYNGTIGEEWGIFRLLYNLLPVVGDNSFSMEVWFMIAIFGGMLLFLYRFKIRG